MPNDVQFIFGPFSLAPARRELRVMDRPVPIGQRALALLTLLVQQAGQVLDKQDLIGRVWPRGVAEETSLRFQIAAIRRALGCGRDGARYIAGVSGRGYCFVAGVRHLPGDATTEAPVDAATGPLPQLPARLSPLVGRADELRRLQQALQTHRAVAIVGAAGMGKSALALALAARPSPAWADGVWHVDLAGVLDAERLPSALAHALGAGTDAPDPWPQLCALLRDRRALLILDHCEHLAGSVGPFIDTLLQRLSALHVLATSRDRLSPAAIHPFALGPLAVPVAGYPLTRAQALAFPAVQLFVERAAAGLGGFALRDADTDAVADICRHLDGMPFALELFAARAGVFGLPGLQAQIRAPLALHMPGRRDAAPRHRTLKSLFDSSYQRLGSAERQLLHRLANTDGAFAQTAAVADTLQSLVDRSWVTVTCGATGPRHRLLATTRLYAQAAQTPTGGAHAGTTRTHSD